MTVNITANANIFLLRDKSTNQMMGKCTGMEYFISGFENLVLRCGMLISERE